MNWKLVWFLLLIASANASDLTSKLKDLKAAFDAQLITKEEFDQAKSNLLAGFSNKESSIRTNSTPKTATAQDPFLKRSKDLEESGKGIVSFFFVSEASEQKVNYTQYGSYVAEVKMPGFLDVSITSDSAAEVKGKLERVSTQVLGSEVYNGFFSMPNTQTVYHQGSASAVGTAGSASGNYNGSTTFHGSTVFNKTHKINIGMFIYKGSFEVPAGDYSVKVSRKFKVSQWGTQRRHRKYDSIEVVPGKITFVPYYWTNNIKFGTFFHPSGNYLNLTKNLTDPISKHIHTSVTKK